MPEQVIVTTAPALQRIIEASVEAATRKLIPHLLPAAVGPKEWFTNKEACSFLGLSKTTLQRYRDTGTLPYSKIGGNIYYKYSDLVEVLEQNLVE